MQVEKELCIFASVPVFTVGRLNDYPYVIIAQGELNTKTKDNVSVTNRVRATYDSECQNPVYTTTTKFRTPRAQGSIDTHAPQVEFKISAEDFETVMGACTQRHLKRRYTVPLPTGVTVEFDRYLELEDPIRWSKIFKIDIERGDPTQIDVYLSELRDLGFHLGEIINPPGVESPDITKAIDELMGHRWNLSTKALV